MLTFNSTQSVARISHHSFQRYIFRTNDEVWLVRTPEDASLYHDDHVYTNRKYSLCDAVRQRIPDKTFDIPRSKAVVRIQSGHVEHASFRTTRAIYTAVNRPSMKIGAAFNFYMINLGRGSAIIQARSSSAMLGP